MSGLSTRCRGNALPRIAGLGALARRALAPGTLALGIGAFFLFSITPGAAGQDRAAISGTVVDAQSGAPVSQAEVVVRGSALRALSDADGRFLIQDVVVGDHTLLVGRLGYVELATSVTLEPGGLSDLSIQITPAAITLEELTVTPGRFSFGGPSGSARQTMTRLDIESVPQMADDIFRAVNRLPGLTSNDFSAHFRIRGGRADETLILFDGLEIYEPYHLKDFNDGAISILDVETVGGVDLMTGGFPVKWGDRTSGIFSIESRDPEVERTRYSFGLSLVNARAMAEGTYGEGRGSWMASARRGYLDLVLNLLGESGLPSPAYYDVFAKTRYEFSEEHSLSMNLLHARDSYTFDAASTTGFNDTIDTREKTNNRYGNSYVWLTSESALSDQLSVTTLASAGFITADRDGTEFYTATTNPQYAITNTRNFTVLGLKQDWAFRWSNRMISEFGFDVRSHDADYAISTHVGPDPDNPSPDTLVHYPVVTRTDTKRSGNTFAAYLGNRLQVVDPLTIEFGVRYDRSSFTGDSDVSPRANALVRMSDRNSLRFGWGQYRQMQGIGELAVLNSQAEYFPSERSDQWTLGFEHIFESGGVFRAEAYSKSGTGLRPVYRNWKGVIDIFPETDEDRVLAFPDSSTSRGVEFYVQKELNDRTSIRASYALSKLEEHTPRIENVNDPYQLTLDPVYDAPQDQRHAVNFDVTYRLRDKWSVNTSYAFHTGWPATFEMMTAFINEEGATDYVVRPQKIWGGRLPSYHRVDMRATRRVRTRRGDLRLFIEVSNLTNHKNVFAYDYFRMTDPTGVIRLQRDEERGFIILPSIGVTWTGNLFGGN